MSQMNPKEVLDNTAYSVQLPYIAGIPINMRINDAKNQNYIFVLSFNFKGKTNGSFNWLLLLTWINWITFIPEVVIFQVC